MQENVIICSNEHIQVIIMKLDTVHLIMKVLLFNYGKRLIFLLNAENRNCRNWLGISNITLVFSDDNRFFFSIHVTYWMNYQLSSPMSYLASLRAQKISLKFWICWCNGGGGGVGWAVVKTWKTSLFYLIFYIEIIIRNIIKNIHTKFIHYHRNIFVDKV